MITQNSAEINRAKAEISFMKASRSRGIKGYCNRGNFMELIIRCAHQLDGSNENFLQDFVDKFIIPIMNKSELLLLRRQIRANNNINIILNENQAGLQKMFLGLAMFKKPNGVGMKQAVDLLDNFQDFEAADITKYFKFSKMTIVDEDNGNSYYHILQYVEFLEFIVRIALKSEFTGKDEEKVVLMLREIYKLTNTDAKVVEPEYDD